MQIIMQTQARQAKYPNEMTQIIVADLITQAASAVVRGVVRGAH